MTTPYFRAVAVDYDGTITTSDCPAGWTLKAIDDARGRGVRMILVTGRILSELRRVFSDVDAHFDAIVAENGAVLATEHGTRLLARPVESVLVDAVAARGVKVRRGEVLLAGDASAAPLVLDEVFRLGFDYQLVQNRGALMVLPSGVSKRSGLFEVQRRCEA